MRLTEIKDKVKKITVYGSVYESLVQLIQTVTESETNDSHQMLADELQRAEQHGKNWKAPFTESTKSYLLHNVIPGLIESAENTIEIRTLQRFQAKLYASLGGK